MNVLLSTIDVNADTCRGCRFKVDDGDYFWCAIYDNVIEDISVKPEWCKATHVNVYEEQDVR